MASAHQGRQLPERPAGALPRRVPSPRRDGRERTKEALLEAAQRLWAERGINGASLDDIATAAGLTKGAVYSNFTGKTDLLLALLERYTHKRFGTATLDLLHDPALPVPERLHLVGKSYQDDLATDAARLLALLQVEFWLYGMRDYAAGWRLAEWYDERRHHLARTLPEIDGIPPEVRATLAMAMDFGLAAQHLLDPDRVPATLYATGLTLILGPALS